MCNLKFSMTPIFSKLFTIILLLYPILNLYSIINNSFDLGIISIAAFSLAYIIKLLAIDKVNFRDLYKILINSKFNRCYLMIFIYSSIITLIYAYDFHYLPAISRLIKEAIFVFIILFLGNQLFDIKFSVKCLKIITIIIFSLILFQLILYHLYGEVWFPWLSIFKLHYGNFTYDSLVNTRIGLIRHEGFRPTSVFFEPAQCAQYLSIIICVFLIDYYYNKNKNTIIFALISTLAAMSTLSLIAFATTNLIWLLFFVVNFREHKMLTTILLCVVISFNFACSNLRGMAPIFVQKQAVVLNKDIKKSALKNKQDNNLKKPNILMKTEKEITHSNINVKKENNQIVINHYVKKNIFYRVNEFINNKKPTSGNLRLKRGYYIYYNYDVLRKAFGVGFENIVPYLETNKLVTPYDVKTPNFYKAYMNYISYILCTGGLVLLFMYFNLFRILWNRNILQNLLLVTFLIIASVSAIQHQAIICLFFCIYESYKILKFD